MMPYENSSSFTTASPLAPMQNLSPSLTPSDAASVSSYLVTGRPYFKLNSISETHPSPSHPPQPPTTYFSAGVPVPRHPSTDTIALGQHQPPFARLLLLRNQIHVPIPKLSKNLTHKWAALPLLFLSTLRLLQFPMPLCPNMTLSDDPSALPMNAPRLSSSPLPR